ncbi:hypothetical protein llap_14217 [Limosa lapponica baueri]|uniref:Uncharacterized protein n=1 Tax=Limosa lapponica baueri TaxID=1758121 RepID=A0A2I0TNW1_LIMLA|nr:hypothetical protein llap_14217 [Limosa lapponica baueri]
MPCLSCKDIVSFVSPVASGSFISSDSCFGEEVTSDSAGDVIEVYYGDNRFGTMTDSGTATLKPRPRVRPLLTFLPLVSIRLAAGIRYGSACNWCPEPAGLAAAALLYLGGEIK